MRRIIVNNNKFNKTQIRSNLNYNFKQKKYHYNYKTKRINFSVSGFFKAYWKYYNLYDVYITHPNQTVYTNMGRSEKTRF